jgi:glutamine amidotransferase
VTESGKLLFRGIPDSSYFYFVHSFYVAPDDTEVSAGITEYGSEFSAALFRENIAATQFHPEKSQDCGLQLLENFIGLIGT